LIDDNYISPVFHTTLSSDTIYAAYIYGRKASAFSVEGDKLFDFKTDQSEAIKPLDISSLSSNPRQQARELSQIPHTSVYTLHANTQNLFIQYHRMGNGFETDTTRWFFDIYRKDGTLEYSGVDSPAKLLHADVNLFYLVKENKFSEFGSYVIYEYKYGNN